MRRLVEDYLALPEVRFLAEHWVAVLILWLVSLGAAVSYLWKVRRR